MFESWDSCLDNGTVATLRCVPIVFKNLVSLVLAFVGVTAVFLIIWAGIGFVISRGDPKKIEGARKTMTFAIIGMVIVLCSFAILFFIGYITNSTDCITSVFDADKFLTGCN